MGPAEFAGKEEERLKWKEATEDYVDALHPVMKQALSLAAQVKSPATDRLQVNLTEDEWGHAGNPFMLLKRKTAGEARSLAMCVDRQNGYEAWRLLVGRFEPQAGIRRMKKSRSSWRSKTSGAKTSQKPPWFYWSSTDDTG